MRRLIILFIALSVYVHTNAGNRPVFSSKDYVIALKKVTDVMVNDVTSPVAASRYYAYLAMTAYEVEAIFDKQVTSLSGFLPAYTRVAADTSLLRTANSSYAVIYSVLRMGEKLLPSGYMLAGQMDSLNAAAAKKKVTGEEIRSTRLLVDDIIRQLLAFVKADRFGALSGLVRYTPREGNAYWQPTSPSFMQALEPYWNTLRPFVLDSAAQFKPPPPAAYDTSHRSDFYRLLNEVYNFGKNATAQQKDIAMFWDCNPFALQQIGHLEFGIKKISPGGHWLGIAGIACLKKKFTLHKTVFIHAILSITLADAFISCWDEKFRSERVRPETSINRMIDPYWRPLLQTPPFPEYPSGHSVVSSAAAVVLTALVGDDFAYTDDTEVEFGLPARRFKSFFQASSEAGISRLYGGIHYRDAIEKGQEQGQKIGEFILQRLSRVKNH